MSGLAFACGQASGGACRDAWFDPGTPPGAVPGALSKFSSRLLAHFESLGPSAALSALPHLIAVDAPGHGRAFSNCMILPTGILTWLAATR